MNSDLMLCLGSSMKVSPAQYMPANVKQNGGKIVSINLQKTSIDKKCALVIHEHVDKVMAMLMQKLNVPIPQYQKVYRLRLNMYHDAARAADAEQKMHVYGVNENYEHQTIFRKLSLTGVSEEPLKMPKKSSDKQPYEIKFMPPAADAETEVKMLVEF